MKEFLFRIARSDASGHFIGYAFGNMASLMPVERVVETPKTIVFRHPVPQWEHHLLAVPKKSLRGLSSIDFSNPTHVEHIRDLLKAIQQASAKGMLETYAILLNGGKYQDVPQLHFHLVAGKNKDGIEPLYIQYRSSVQGKGAEIENGVFVLESSSPFREFHAVIYSKEHLGSIQKLDLDNNQDFSMVFNMFKIVQGIVDKSKLDQYTLLSIHQPGDTISELAFHLVSGKSIEKT